SGAVGAALILCPRAKIKVLYWVILFFGTIEIPAVIWIAFWFAEQVYFGSRSYGNVGYFAHIGGFVAGAAVAWVLQLAAVIRRGRRAPPLEPRDSASLAEPRRLFREIPEAADPAFLDDSIDTFAVVTLEDAADRSARISEIAGAGSRIGATHGVVIRSVSRAEADRIRLDLKVEGIASALVADVPPNYPPVPRRAESVSWDDRVLRFRMGDQSVPVPWSAPFLFVAA